MKSLNIYEYDQYRKYLADWLETQSQKAIKKQLAQFLGCQPAFVSHVIAERNDFSLEQAEALARFMRLDSEESDFFIHLVGYERSATLKLKEYYLKKINEIKEKTRLLKDRLKIQDTLSHDDQVKYYSRWYYAAIHMAVALPNLRTKESFEKKFSLPSGIVDEAVEFLLKKNLIKKLGSEYFPTTKKLHLEKNSPLIVQHHANWRLKALDSLSREKESELHYSGVITCSKKDFSKIKGIIVKTLEEVIDTLGPSKEEEIGVLNMDLFQF